MRSWRLKAGIVAVVGATCVLPAIAFAAAPSNDARENAEAVTLGTKVNGTTAESTLEANEPPTDCAAISGSVWYSVTAPAKGDIVASLKAAGDLDATVEVFRRTRSQLTSIDCQTTDKDGAAESDFRVAAGDSFLIRVGQRSNSVPGTFQLDVELAVPPENPPGKALPAKGAKGTLDRVANPSDAYAIRMDEGVKYRFNLSSSAEDSCLPLSLYPPHTTSFDDGEPVDTLRCGGYATFTPGPGEGGVYSLVPAIGRQKDATSYRLQAGRVGADDVAPGIFVRNYSRIHGSLNALGLDVQDLYRFDVTRRSALNLGFKGTDGMSLSLLKDSGGRLDTTFAGEGSGIKINLSKGRYYAVVRAATGRTASTRSRACRRRSRARARASTGASRTRSGRTASVDLAALVTTRATGPADMFVERFDPVDGWSFLKRFRVHVASGRAHVSFRPPAIGSYRVHVEYLGSRGSQASESGFAHFRVQAPLVEKR